MRRPEPLRQTDASKHSPDRSATTIPDGGREELPTVDEPEATEFIWGRTRKDEDGRSNRPSATEELNAVEDRLDELADTAAHLSILATNANLKLAREEPRELAEIAYDVEADARQLHRSIEDLESCVDRLRDHLEGSTTENATSGSDQPSESREAHGASRRSRRNERVEGRATGGRANPQLPVGDRYPSGPWRTAGVDLTNWPGHLARIDYDRIRRRIARSETVATGSVPPDVAGFSLDEDELPFESLLALANAGGPGPVDGGKAADSSRGTARDDHDADGRHPTEDP